MSQAALVKGAQAMSKAMRALTERRLAGKIDSDRWYDGCYDAIYDGHLAAWVAGRQIAGVEGPADDDDRRQARRLADFQSEYLDGFRDALDEGRYDDEDESDAGSRKAGGRCDLYALSIRGSASEAWASAQDEDDEIDWVLSGDEHCDGCIALAAQSPYTPNTLYAYPGQGDTECGMHCHCHLATASGEGPKRIALYP